MSQATFTAAVQTLYSEYINTDVPLSDDRLEAFQDALFSLCGEDFTLFEQVSMELGIA